MKIYLAASFARIEEMRNYADGLRLMGHSVTSHWITGAHDADDGISAAVPSHAICALEDIQDIEEAQVLIAFTEPPRTTYGRGGRHVEMGYALASGKIVIVVGHRENVFCFLDEVIFIESIAQISTALDEAERRRFPKLGNLAKDAATLRRLDEEAELRDDDEEMKELRRSGRDGRSGHTSSVGSLAKQYGR